VPFRMSKYAEAQGAPGLHLYVYLAGIPHANHTEHAALARAYSA